MSDNSDEPITVPQSDRQTAVDAVVDAITANRGTPERATVSRHIGMRYNTAADEITYHSEEDRRLAEQPAEPNPIDDGVDILASFKALTDTAIAEGAKLSEHSFNAETGAKVYALPEGSEARRVQEMKVRNLLQRVEYQEGVYSRAMEARATRDAANVRAAEATAIEQAWTGGDPERQRVLDKAKLEAEARHVADAALRTKLGTLGK